MGTPSRPQARPAHSSDGTDLPPDGFEEAVHALRVPLLNLARRLLADSGNTEDLVQDVMVELWSHRARFDPARGSLSAWASAILRNRAIDRVRSLRAQAARDERYAAASAAPPYDQVQESVEQRLEHEAVRRHLPELSPVLAEAVDLVYYRGLGSQQAAAVAGVSLSAFSSRLRAARKRLRELMDDVG